MGNIRRPMTGASSQPKTKVANVGTYKRMKAPSPNKPVITFKQSHSFGKTFRKGK